MNVAQAQISLPNRAPSANRRLLVIHNPTAGRRRLRRVAATLEVLRAEGAEVVLARTTGRGDAERIAREADPCRFDAIVVAGGDGTINEALNGLDLANFALGVIPCGTANVLARELGLPMDPAGIARVLARAPERRVRLGLANGRRFAMMAGVGLDARAVETVSLPFKRALGKLAYGISILGAIAEAPPARFTVRIGEGESSAAWVVAAKGRHYAGGFIIAERADLARPDFVVCLCSAGGPLHAFRYLASLGVGAFALNRDVRFVATSSLAIDGPEGAQVQADGEIVARLPVAIAIEPAPLRVLAP